MFELSERVEDAEDQEDKVALYRDVLESLDEVGGNIQGDNKKIEGKCKSS